MAAAAIEAAAWAGAAMAAAARAAAARAEGKRAVVAMAAAARTAAAKAAAREGGGGVGGGGEGGGGVCLSVCHTKKERHNHPVLTPFLNLERRFFTGTQKNVLHKPSIVHAPTSIVHGSLQIDRGAAARAHLGLQRGHRTRGDAGHLHGDARQRGWSPRLRRRRSASSPPQR